MFLYGDITNISHKSAAVDVLISGLEELEELEEWWVLYESRRKWEPLDRHRLLMYKMKICEPLGDKMKITRHMDGKTKILKFVDDSYECINEDQDYDARIEVSVSVDGSYEHDSEVDDPDDEIETPWLLYDSSEHDSEGEDCDSDISPGFAEGRLQMIRCYETAINVWRNGRFRVNGTFSIFRLQFSGS